MGEPQERPVDEVHEQRVENQILDRVQELIDDEHQLRAQLAKGEVGTGEENQALARVERELDQCWDLLRQRRAKRDAGQDPGQVSVRPQSKVEGYLN